MTFTLHRPAELDTAEQEVEPQRNDEVMVLLSHPEQPVVAETGDVGERELGIYTKHQRYESIKL